MGNRREKAKKMLSDKQFEETKHYSKKYAATVLSIISIVLVILTIVGGILLYEYIDDLEAYAKEHMVIGSVIFSFVCAFQVVIAFIPGEVVEVAAGVLFGPWWGTLFCLVAETAGSVIVILLVRKFGRRLVESLYPREKIDALPILKDRKKRNTFIFLLFAIPGTPKDFLTYIIGLTKVSIPMYILLTFFARIPSIITSTFAGASISDGRLVQAAVIMAVTAVISGVGYLIYQAIQKKNSVNKDTAGKKVDALNKAEKAKNNKKNKKKRSEKVN